MPWGRATSRYTVNISSREKGGWCHPLKMRACFKRNKVETMYLSKHKPACMRFCKIFKRKQQIEETQLFPPSSFIPFSQNTWWAKYGSIYESSSWWKITKYMYWMPRIHSVTNKLGVFHLGTSPQFDMGSQKHLLNSIKIMVKVK